MPLPSLRTAIQEKESMWALPGASHRGHADTCFLRPGCLRVRRAYPKFWTFYLKLLAHGISHDTAKQQVRECFELASSESKQVQKCEKDKKAAEQREASRERMEGVAKKKKRIEQEVKDHYYESQTKNKRQQVLGQVKREQMEDEFEFDAEGIFETPGGGTTQLGAGQASGHQNEAPSLPLPDATPHPPTAAGTSPPATAAAGTSPPASAAGTTRPFIAAPPNPPTPSSPTTIKGSSTGKGAQPCTNIGPADFGHVMHQGPYNVQFGGAWHTIPHEPREFADRGRFDTARHLCPMCGQMCGRFTT